MMKTGNMPDRIENMDYARVVSAKKMKGSGLERGDVVLVTGLKPSPVVRSDPYLQRIYVLVVKVVEGEHQLPNEDNDYKVYLVDPRNLEKVNEEEKDELTSQLHKQYGR
jgi:hypothetical protein